MLIRSWNLFHGNTVPPGRHAYLRHMVHLASADRPDVLCLQELPLWSFRALEAWSGMTAVADAARGRALPPPLDRAITALYPGVFRSAFTGQGNAVLLAAGIRVLARNVLTLHPPAPFSLRRERRICQVLRLELADGRTLLLGHLHATNARARAAVEVAAAAAALIEAAEPSEPLILAGDLNTHAELDEWGAGGGRGIDHVLVRGLEAGPLEVWPDRRRRHEGRLLSDHAPVERRVA